MYLAIDIGTTSITFLLSDKKGTIIYKKTIDNDFNLNGKAMQDANSLVNCILKIVEKINDNYQLTSIGISNQMHGIVYLNEKNEAISPLFTWQDEKGNYEYKNTTYANYLKKISKSFIVSGFGSTTLFYDTVNNKIPPHACKICTIGDYLSLKLTNNKNVFIHESNAASLGLYDLKNHCFNKKVIKKAKINLNYYPNVINDYKVIGFYKNNIKVYVAVGDNQASVYGSLNDDDSILINVGTGSQIAIISSNYKKVNNECEIRPYFDNKYLLIGGAICGGYSYQILKNFYKGINENITYEKMNELALDYKKTDNLIVKTQFKGKRSNSKLKGMILNISDTNFTPSNLTYGFLKGMIDELYEYYSLLMKNEDKRSNLVGSGNGIRFNKALRLIIEDEFKMKLTIPEVEEEAAYGIIKLMIKNKQEN